MIAKTEITPLPIVWKRHFLDLCLIASAAQNAGGAGLELLHQPADFRGLLRAISWRQDHIRRLRPLRWALKLALGLWLIWAGGVALVSMFHGREAAHSDWLTMFLPGVFLLAAGLFLLSGGRAVRLRAWLSWRAYGEKGTACRYSFYDGQFEQRLSSGENRSAYAEIQAVLEDRERYYLFVGRNVAHILRKSDFIAGSEGAFRAFLTEKTGKSVQFIK